MSLRRHLEMECRLQNLHERYSCGPRKRFHLPLLSCLLVFAGLLHGQAGPSPAATITSSTELVLIPAVVNDKSGAHISGLKKEDFALKLDGKSRPIAVFEEVKTSSALLHRSQGGQNTFTNVEPGGSDYHRLSIIVLDLVNTPFADQSSARAALLKFLSEIAESNGPVCLLALNAGGLTVLHDFTDDPRLLAVALGKARGNVAPLIIRPAMPWPLCSLH